MIYPLPLPRTSSEAFWKYQEANPQGQNPGLIFDRFMPDWNHRADELKETGLLQVIKSAEKASEELLSAWNVRWEKMVSSARGNSQFTMQTDWRMVAGLGRKGSLEIGFTFHRYGFPHLPGSSLKGLARAWSIAELAAELGENLGSLHEAMMEREPRLKDKLGPLGALNLVLSKEKETDFEEELHNCGASSAIVDKGKGFRAIFGTTEHGGHVIFFDAIPRSKPRLELDIMNPHYPQYYKEGSTEYPTAWQSPIPVKFLTVAPGSVFRFAVAWRRAPIDDISLESIREEKAQREWSWFKNVTRLSNPDEPNPLLNQAQAWLKAGLSELGAGGKTSAGYGYFKEPGPPPTSPGEIQREKQSLPHGYERGVVKHFGLGESKSFGFITRSNGADLFVHRNNLASGLSELHAGRKVIFRVGKGPRGPQAQDVQLE
jgi:CRISPR-associated protein Cmr6